MGASAGVETIAAIDQLYKGLANNFIGAATTVPGTEYDIAYVGAAFNDIVAHFNKGGFDQAELDELKRLSRMAGNAPLDLEKVREIRHPVRTGKIFGRIANHFYCTETEVEPKYIDTINLLHPNQTPSERMYGYLWVRQEMPHGQKHAQHLTGMGQALWTPSTEQAKRIEQAGMLSKFSSLPRQQLSRFLDIRGHGFMEDVFALVIDTAAAANEFTTITAYRDLRDNYKKADEPGAAEDIAEIIPQESPHFTIKDKAAHRRAASMSKPKLWLAQQIIAQGKLVGAGDDPAREAAVGELLWVFNEGSPEVSSMTEQLYGKVRSILEQGKGIIPDHLGQHARECMALAKERGFDPAPPLELIRQAQKEAEARTAVELALNN